MVAKGSGQPKWNLCMNLGKVDLCPATPMKNLNLYRLVPSMLWSVVIWKQIPTSYILFLTDKRTDACSRSLCYTLRFLTNKKRQKHEKKPPPPQKKKKLPVSYATFQCGRYNVFKTIFLPTKIWKTASKVAHNQPKPFISQFSPAHSPELIFHIIKCQQQAFVSYLCFFF